MADKLLELAKSLASSYGYQTAIYVGKYEGHSVYMPLYDDGKKRWTGPPKFFIENNGTLTHYCDTDFTITALLEEQILAAKKCIATGTPK